MKTIFILEKYNLGLEEGAGVFVDFIFNLVDSIAASIYYKWLS